MFETKIFLGPNFCEGKGHHSLAVTIPLFTANWMDLGKFSVPHSIKVTSLGSDAGAITI